MKNRMKKDYGKVYFFMFFKIERKTKFYQITIKIDIFVTAFKVK